MHFDDSELFFADAVHLEELVEGGETLSFVTEADDPPAQVRADAGNGLEKCGIRPVHGQRQEEKGAQMR